jgi:hypothetical protein
MSRIKDTKNKIISKIEAVKKINDDSLTDIFKSKKKGDESVDKFLKDLPTTEKLFGKKLSDYTNKKKNNKDNNKEIFEELLEVVGTFIGTTNKVESSDTLSNTQKLKQMTLDSADFTLKKSKKIITDNVSKILFAGDGICGANLRMPENSIQLSPEEFDILNVLTVDPNSSSGKIVYEIPNNSPNFIQMNRELYNSFTTSPVVFPFNTKGGEVLFNMSWNTSNQEYTFFDLKGADGLKKVDDFILDYYSSIEFLDISGVTKNAMLMTLQGDGTEPPLFDKGFNDLNRLLKKIFASCGNPANGLVQNPTNQFNDNDEDDEFYFDFDDIEGIDLDDEDARYKKVLKFKDCNNYQIQSNPEHFEDFVYMSERKNVFDAVNDVLLHTAGETYEKSGQSQPIDNFHISILTTFIKNLPKALAGAVLSPKYVLPIVILYKSTVKETITVFEMMKKMSKLFKQILTDLYWTFIGQFWKLVKVELLSLITKLAAKILKNKTKKYYLMVTALIALLTKLLQTNIDTCNNLYGLIDKTIDSALNMPGGEIPIPGILLGLSHYLPGYSSDRAFMATVEKLESAGISTQPIFGESNTLLSALKLSQEGVEEERARNGFERVANEEIIVQTPVGPFIIPPGILMSSGKSF